MKKVEDFKIVNGIAVLEGISYKEEAIIVEEFLKSNTNIKNVSLRTKDNRNYELNNGKLILSKDSLFQNPYYTPNSNVENIQENLITELGNKETIKLINDFKQEILGFSKRTIDILDRIIVSIKG